MTRSVCLAVFFVLPLVSACASSEPPPREALNVTCDTGGRHGPSGILDYRCVDGDGEERLRPQSLHEVIEGAPIEARGDKS